MLEIIPAIMPDSLEDLEEKVELVIGSVPLVQIDIMDGKFVKGKTWPYVHDHGTFLALQTEDTGLPMWEKLDYEIDLMVAHPEEIIDSWITAGASRIIVHVESTKKLEEIVKNIRARFAFPEGNEKKDLELGLALNPTTPTDIILPHLEDIDFVQFMGIDTIGLQGEAFDEQVLTKIHEFHNAHPEVVISVDGGVTVDNAKELVDAGVKRLVSGSAIFDSDNPHAVIGDFRKNL